MNHLSRALGCAVLVSVVLAGCSGQQDKSSDDSDTDPDRASSSPSTAEPDSSAAEASEEPSPAIAPATGDTIRVKGMKVKVPAHWKAGSASSLQAAGWAKETPESLVTLFRFPQGLVKSLDQLTRASAKRTYWAFDLERRDDLAIDGQVVTHLSGKANPGEYVEVFTTLRYGESLEMKFNFTGGESKAERDEIVQSMLATLQFTS